MQWVICDHNVVTVDLGPHSLPSFIEMSWYYTIAKKIKQTRQVMGLANGIALVLLVKLVLLPECVRSSPKHLSR